MSLDIISIISIQFILPCTRNFFHFSSWLNPFSIITWNMKPLFLVIFSMFSKVFSGYRNYKIIRINKTQLSFTLVLIFNLVVTEFKDASIFQVENKKNLKYPDFLIIFSVFFISVTRKFSENHLVIWLLVLILDNFFFYL